MPSSPAGSSIAMCLWTTCSLENWITLTSFRWRDNNLHLFSCRARRCSITCPYMSHACSAPVVSVRTVHEEKLLKTGISVEQWTLLQLLATGGAGSKEEARCLDLTVLTWIPAWEINLKYHRHEFQKWQPTPHKLENISVKVISFLKKKNH